MRRSVGAVVYEEECDRVEMRWERGFFDNPRWYRLPSGALDDILVAGDVPALEGQRGSGDRVRFFDEDQDDAVNL